MRTIAITFLALAASPASASVCTEAHLVSIAPVMSTIETSWRAGAVNQTTLEVKGCAPFTVTAQIVGIEATGHGERARVYLTAEQGGQITHVGVQVGRGGNELAPFLTTANGKLTWVFSAPDRQALKPSVKSDI